jgi:hypothetical protein
VRSLRVRFARERRDEAGIVYPGFLSMVGHVA